MTGTERWISSRAIVPRMVQPQIIPEVIKSNVDSAKDIGIGRPMLFGKRARISMDDLYLAGLLVIEG